MEVFWMWIVVVFLQALLIVICFSLSVLMKCLLDRPGTLPTHQRRRRNNNNNNGHQSGQQSTSQVVDTFRFQPSSLTASIPFCTLARHPTIARMINGLLAFPVLPNDYYRFWPELRPAWFRMGLGRCLWVGYWSFEKEMALRAMVEKIFLKPQRWSYADEWRVSDSRLARVL